MTREWQVLKSINIEYIQYISKHGNQYRYKNYKSLKYMDIKGVLCYRKLVARLVYSASYNVVPR